MKRTMLILLALALGSRAVAQEQDVPTNEPANAEASGLPAFWEKLDTNGDGVLDAGELGAARERRAERRGGGERGRRRAQPSDHLESGAADEPQERRGRHFRGRGTDSAQRAPGRGFRGGERPGLDVLRRRFDLNRDGRVGRLERRVAGRRIAARGSRVRGAAPGAQRPRQGQGRGLLRPGPQRFQERRASGATRGGRGSLMRGRQGFGERGHGRSGGAQRGAQRTKILERFDANGDGKLDETEREALRSRVRGLRGGESKATPAPAPELGGQGQV